MRLEDLALLVLQHHGHGAVQHAAGPGGERRRVTQRVQALAGLHADQLDPGVVDEQDERADRVRAAAHAGDRAVRQRAGAVEQLGARLVADAALQVADERRVGRGPTHGR